MREDVKRMNYYNGLFLKEEEFIAEQKYHIRMRRLMGKLLNNIYGVLEGLEVEPLTDSKKYRVSSGAALSVIEEGDEELAAEMVLPNDFEVDLSNPDFVGKSVYITISYDAKPEDSVPEKGDNPIHIVERPKVIPTLTNADPKKDIVLAVIKLPSDANWKSSNAYIDTSQRREIPVAIRSINGVGSTDNGNIDIQAGSNIKITPDLAGNKLTISAAGGSQWSDGPGGIIYYNKGNVGIGTAAPQRRLQVDGAALTNAGNIADSAGLEVRGASGSWGPSVGVNNGAQEWRIVSWGDNALKFVKVTGNTFTPLTIFNNSFQDALVISNTGIGIGTANPDKARFEVSGMVGNTVGLFGKNAQGISLVANWPNIGFNAYYNSGWKAMAAGWTGIITVDQNTGSLSFHTGVKASAADAALAISERLTVANNGNVGIGTPSPDFKLDVNGSIRFGGFTGNNVDEWPNIVWYRDLNANWDEGLIKHSSSKGFFGRAGFGIHIHQTRDWGIWSSGWTPLFGVEGGTGNVKVRGTITAASKQFQIDHPLDPENKYLIHSSLEGPEIAVFYRGEGRLSEGQVTISLPHYFEALAMEKNRTVILTPKFEKDEPTSMLAASEVKQGRFTVKQIDGKNSSQKFYWEVKAVRADVKILEIEKEKIEHNMSIA